MPVTWALRKDQIKQELILPLSVPDLPAGDGLRADVAMGWDGKGLGHDRRKRLQVVGFV